jgi:hypothetical protein
MRLCGICEVKTINKEFCNKCHSRSERMEKEIKKRLAIKKSIIA